eukprot:5571833-Amphidinium_carterae.1
MVIGQATQNSTRNNSIAKDTNCTCGPCAKVSCKTTKSHFSEPALCAASAQGHTARMKTFTAQGTHPTTLPAEARAVWTVDDSSFSSNC